MALKGIQPARRRLADEVYEQLMYAIMSREIGPDNRLVQAGLAAELSISRTPVREALMRLEQEGVLEVSSRGSFRLYLINDKEFRDLYQARAAIEGRCARILADKPKPESIAEIRKTVKFEETSKVRMPRHISTPIVQSIANLSKWRAIVSCSRCSIWSGER